MLKAIRLILISIIIIILLLDTLLWQLDPLGIHAYFYAQYRQQFVMEAASHGYNLQAGTHDFGNYTVTIDASGNRIVPDSHPSDCTIAVVGDSVTFGVGVADGEPFVNLLARAYPAIEWLNVSRSGYSAENIALLQDAYPADGYLWLIISNDHYGEWENPIKKPTGRFPSATALYRAYLTTTPAPAEPDWNDYWQAVDDIMVHATLVFGFEGESPAIETSERYPVYLIPRYTETVSKYDNHPNATGHQQIASSIAPYVANFIAAICAAD